MNDEEYIEKFVHPTLDKLGTALAQWMPSNPDEFARAWIMNDGNVPEAMGAQREASADERKAFVTNKVAPLIWQVTYDCLNKKPENVMEFLKKRAEEEGQVGGDSDDATSSGDEMDDAELERMQRMMEEKKEKGDRRIAVSAEKMTEKEMADWKPPFYEKTAAQRDELRALIRRSKDGKMHMLFGLVSDSTLEKVLDAMLSKNIAVGEDVIRQGAEGDYFYIVKSGKFDILINIPGGEKKVWEAGEGFAFGELALLYNAPRSATIRATEESEVWALDRTAFRMLVVMATEEKMKQ